MRVTSEMMITSTLHRLTTRLSEYERTQSELATGRRILAPSDDPSGSGRALSLRAARRSREQEARNATDAKSWLDLADSQLQAAVERLGRVRDLTVRGANGGDAAERHAIAQEVKAVGDELRAIANARHRGRPLFAGYADPAAAVEHDGASWVYRGDRGAVIRRVGDQDTVRVNVTAEEVFGLDPADPAAVNVFNLLDKLAADLEGGDTQAVAAALDGLDSARDAMTDALARVGTTTNWVESAQRRTGDALLAIRAELAEIEDVDLTEAVMDLQTQEIAYQATLQAMARALPPSLVNFLR